VPRFVLGEEAYQSFAQVAYLPLSIIGALIMLYLVYEFTLGRKQQFSVEVEEAG
jgi:hypothetical protein